MTADEVQALRDKVVSEQMWKTLKWGTYGPNQDQPLEKKYLEELETSHLEAILITQPRTASITCRVAIIELLKIRYGQYPVIGG